MAYFKRQSNVKILAVFKPETITFKRMYVDNERMYGLVRNFPEKLIFVRYVHKTDIELRP